MSHIEKSSLTNYVKRTEQIIEDSSSLNEENTKIKIIEPLIKIFGWDLFSDEVYWEYPIQLGSQKKYIDLMLQLRGKPVVGIEIKPVGTEISEREIKQAISYGKVADVKWVTVMNGRQILLYNLEKGKTKEQCMVKSIPLREFVDEREVLALLSKESVKEGRSKPIPTPSPITRLEKKYISFNIEEQEIVEHLVEDNTETDTKLEKYYYPFILSKVKGEIEERERLRPGKKKIKHKTIVAPFLFDGVEGKLFWSQRKTKLRVYWKNHVIPNLLDLSKKEFSFLRYLRNGDLTFDRIEGLNYTRKEGRATLNRLVEKKLVRKPYEGKRYKFLNPLPSLKQAKKSFTHHSWELQEDHQEAEKLNLNINISAINSVIEEIYSEVEVMDNIIVFYPFYAVIIEGKNIKIASGYKKDANLPFRETIYEHKFRHKDLTYVEDDKLL